jgi:phage terminase large subunit GpA-like protein
MIGVDAGKEHIMSGLKVKQPGARMSHFPLDRTKGYDSLYFSGLLSEHMVRNQKGEWRWEKIPGHERNEALDCRNYANAAFKVLHPNMDHLKKLLLEPERAKKPAPKKKKQQKRRTDFGEDDW